MKIKKFVLVFSLLFLGVATLPSCGGQTSSVSTATEAIDYASQLKFNENSGRIYTKVELQYSVDGDTTHFYCDVDEITTAGILKVRYLGIDTPESTGKVQPYGHKASDFTKERVKNATSIIVESDSSEWEADSTGSRYLCWVWYRLSETEDYKLLNLEIMQAGLAAAKNIGGTSYASEMQAAYSQAMNLKLNMWSGEDDPDFYYGTAIQTDIKDIRLNIEDYLEKKVQFEANVTRVSGQTAYVEDYYEDDDRSYGISVYMGFDVNVQGQIKVNTRVRFVGNVEYYEAAGTYQISNLTYMAMKPDYADNVKVIDENVDVFPTEITPSELIEDGDELMSTYVSMKNLTVTDTYTTHNGGDNDGALTLTCTSEDNKTITIRTSVLYHEDKTLVLEDELMGKTIDVVGVVDTYDGETQIHVFLYDDITFVE